MGVKIKERKKGEWWVVIHANSKRKMVKAGSKSAANAIKKKVDIAIAEGKFAISSVKPFSYYCHDWLENIMPTTCKKSTQSDYCGIIKNHLEKAPFWGTPVDLIFEADIENFLIAKQKTKKRSTVVHIKNAISNSFKRAVKYRVLRINPARGVEIRKEDKQPYEPNPYSRTEIEILLDTCREGYPDHYTMVLFFCRTGCRSGEVAGLQWRELNLDRRKATIRRGIVRGLVVETTKSRKIRMVDLTPALVSELRKHRLKSGPGKYVFQTKTGSFVDMNNFRKRVFEPLCKAAELHKTRLHDLRHSYAAAVITGTKDMYYAQKQLGHASIDTTVNTYGHWLEEDEKIRPVDMLDSARG